ncbi:SDR family NAD(P)-dependent oxidoreductase [Vibrio paucivorans]
MEKIAIWGAASGLGAAMAEYYYKQGFEVIAIAREPTNNSNLAKWGIATISCDATDQQQVINTVQALPKGTINISSMGSFNAEVPVDYIGHRYVIDALEQSKNARFLLITSLGCGDSWQYLSERSKRGFGAAVREKSLAESWLQTSGLDFTILRPGGLKDGDATGLGELSQGTEVHGLITRTEVARLSHELLNNKTSIGQVYQCVDPSLSY